MYALPRIRRLSTLAWLLSLTGLVAPAAARAAETPPATPADADAWFERHEQRLMDAIGGGDRALWEAATDASFVLTSEEGEVIARQPFLDGLRPLPAGLAGGIAVKELTVQRLPGVAIVRFLADEWEAVFGQRLTTLYRVTDVYRESGADRKLVASHLSVVTHDPPPQEVSKADWPGYAGSYRLLPDGWTFTVELRDGGLYGGREPKNLRPLIPLAPNVFVVEGRLGEWIFVPGPGGHPARLVDFRKFEPLVWTRVEAP